jgi:ADP-L-glycero-D-manno-heptose 6-epimerase
VRNFNTNFNNKTILITGGAGFIGSKIASYINSNFPLSNIIIFDCFRNEKFHSNGNLLSFGHYKNLIGFKGDVICGNINNKEDISLLKKYKFDFIFHQAAISDTRIYDQELIIKTNVNSFYDIIDVAIKDDATLVYASSASTYGSLASPQIVGAELPENPYGYSKYLMDQITYEVMAKYPRLKIIGLRYFNVYGPGEFYKGKTASMIIQLGHQILNGHAPRLFNDSDKILRDFIYIDDVIQANIKACESKKNGVYNIGTGRPRSFLDIANILQKMLGTNFEIDYISNPFKGYQMHTQADISSSQEFFNFNPKITLEMGIKAYLPEIKNLYQAEI